MSRRLSFLYIIIFVNLFILRLVARIFMGKNSVTQIAFGRTPEEEYKDNLRHVSKVSLSYKLLK